MAAVNLYEGATKIAEYIGQAPYYDLKRPEGLYKFLSGDLHACHYRLQEKFRSPYDEPWDYHAVEYELTRAASGLPQRFTEVPWNLLEYPHRVIESILKRAGWNN